MAISEACKFEIEESVDKACEENKISKSEAFRALETFYNKIGVTIKFSTIRQKYYRAKKDKEIVTNVTSDKPARKHTKPEAKIQLNSLKKAVKTDKVSDDDIKDIMDTVADQVEQGKVSPRVLSKSKTTFKKAARDYGPPRVNRDSDIIKMVNSFHSFLDKLDVVRGKGTAGISKADRKTMDQEFKLMVPRLLRLLDWMGIDLQALLTNYVNHFKEGRHVKQDTKGLLSD
jgi:hypothetical protein